ncbi:hypothetical protein K505DRAFT_325346 [Melanomma pulvis-pyrius CBS 109.77]|uniref:F-box domain-containing protein n=1 Tax=Melanomma pulvis-pyrius CBS 109.77 TaxID=1314802 RepID=A0A6A6XD60_9PLEO|nr:hypothetical protein K505DRAFT_325346 [Melanomma pulvis-pyrius CBS 109.77]
MAISSLLTASSSDSREGSPILFDTDAAPGDTDAPRSAFLRLPVDIFKCVTDYLDRDAAWSLKRVCKGMSRSEVVAELLYREPIQLNDVRDIRLGDWKYRTMGRHRWLNFQACIDDSNRRYVQKLAMSHWCSIADFQWIQDNLPALNSLDLTAIKDFVWTPEEIWTWKQLAAACPKLFGRLEELEVSNWADYPAHSRIEYSYAYNDYRFKQRFRMSRRRDGGSVAKMIFPVCTTLKTLAIRERNTGFHTWNEWEVHQRVCCLVDGIVKHTPKSLTRLRVHDYAPYRSLFSTDASTWENLADVEIGLYSWMEDRRDRDVIGPIPYRIAPGHHHRDEEEAFDDKTFDTCDRNHIHLGKHVVQGVSASFEDLLQNLSGITRKYPHIRVKPISTLRNIVLHPFHLVNVTQPRGHALTGALQLLNATAPQTDPLSSKDIKEALRWLAEKCDWSPILSWESMMCDAFPANLEPSRSLLPKADVLSRIQFMIKTLRSLNIPVRISIGDRSNTCPSSGLDGSLYFGDCKTFVGEEPNCQETLAPTQARFNLTLIAPLVDELTIQYPIDVPGVAGWSRTSKRITEAERMLLMREMKGWRRFWARYALQFKNLKKLTAIVPSDIYNDWGKCESLGNLLQNNHWEMLDIDDKGMDDVGSFNGQFLLSSLRYGLARKRSRMKFVQRVFFRQDNAELSLDPPNAYLSDLEREENEISEETIATNKDRPPHRFWPRQALRTEKRKAEESEEEEEEVPAKKKNKSD